MDNLDFFEKGYYVTKIPDEFMSTLWLLAYTTNWVEKHNTTHLQYHTEYVKVPSWHPEVVTNSPKPYDTDHYYGSKAPEHHPKELVDIGEKLIDHNIMDVIKAWRKPKLKFLTMWNGAGNLPWHSDMEDTTDMIAVMYLTEEETWDDNWGGTIELRKEPGNKYYRKVQPLSGTMVIMNNTNPLMQHRITPLVNKDVNRYTFNFTYSWN
jgi:hypothetical protein